METIIHSIYSNILVLYDLLDTQFYLESCTVEKSHHISHLSLFRVVNIPFDENKSSQQLLDGLNQRLTILGAVKSGMHYIDCDVYQSQVPHGNNFTIYSAHKV